MVKPQRWRCWKCATTLRTRRVARINAHQRLCDKRKPRQMKQSETGVVTTRRARRDGGSVDLSTDGRETPALTDWKQCPIRGCNLYIQNRQRRLDHLQRHIQNRDKSKTIGPTPAEQLVHCLRSSPGPSRHISDEDPDIEIDSTHDTSKDETQGQSNDSSLGTAYYALSQPISRVENVRLKSVEERVSFKLTERGLVLARNGHLLALMDTIIRDIIEKHKHHEHARLRIIFDSDSLDYAFSETFQRADDFDVFNFLEHMERILNSKQSVGSDDNIQIYVQSIADPISGSGRHTFRRKDYANTRDFFRLRKSIFYINNTDHSCFFMAVAAGLRFMGLNGYKSKREKNVQKNKRESPRWVRAPHRDKKLIEEANLIRVMTGISGNQPVAAQHFPEIQRTINENFGVQLIILNSEDSNSIWFAGEPLQTQNRKLHLAYGSNHYCYIKRIRTYLNQHRICHLCYKSYLNVHRCSLKCDRCETKECFEYRKDAGLLTEISAPTKCKRCGLMFYSERCKYEHQKRGVCQNYTTCPKCERIYRNISLNNELITHQCNSYTCLNCKETVASGHLCTTQVPSIVDKKKFIVIIFDIETYVDTKKVHKPYLICMDRVCEMCCDVDFEANNECPKCGPRTQIFYGTNCAAEFCDYLIRGCNEGAVLLSHYGSGFDNYFIIDHIIGEHGNLNVTTRGHRFLTVNIGRNIKMLDTYMFFFCKLSALSSIFEIPEQKGHFPFRIATKDNLDMKLQKHPSPSYYGFDQMNANDRKHFMEWHVQIEDKPFDFRLEAIRYCCMDVTLLRKASMRFRRLFVDTYGVDPWQNAVTLSHLASLIFRKCFMSPGVPLGIMPSSGYTDLYKKQTSLLCIKYLEWIKQESGSMIIHGGTELEPRFLGRYPCDGVELRNVQMPVSIENTKRIWDIRGCFYHVHRDNCSINRRVPEGDIAYSPNDLNQYHPLKKNMTYRDILDADNLRVEWFKSRGIEVSVVYECEIEQMKKDDGRVADFFNHPTIWQQYVLPIGPRQALFGGRVTVGRLLCELTQEQQDNGYEILYDDIISLYPYVMRSNPYPIGHPRIIKYPDLPNFLSLENIDDYFGLIKIKVLPPQHLLYGVLPCRMNNKLVFPLCFKCAEEYPSCELQEDDFDEIGNIVCSHTNNERSFWGVYCNVEIKLAIEMGYEVLHISEIWKYEPGDLFSGYVNGMIAMKVENSGYPENCITECGKKDYVDSMAMDDIIINPDNIRKCNGKRQIGKLFANSLWGKISQGIDITNTAFVKEPKELSKLLRDPAVDITDVFLNRGQCLCISSKRRNEVQRQMPLYSPTVGAFVTAYGRIRLYKLMIQAGENFIYGDTDSVIYLTGPGKFKTDYGTKIGDVSSEINWPIDAITNFVATGPKTYSYKTRLGNTCIKAKGLSLKSETGENVNFDHLKAIVLGQTKEIGPMFYDMLDEPLRGRLISLHDEKLKSQSKPFLLLPQNRIKKDKTSIELENSEMIKILQSSGGDKRRTLRHPSLRTVEFGYKTQPYFFTP